MNRKGHQPISSARQKPSDSSRSDEEPKDAVEEEDSAEEVPADAGDEEEDEAEHQRRGEFAVFLRKQMELLVQPFEASVAKESLAPAVVSMLQSGLAKVNKHIKAAEVELITGRAYHGGALPKVPLYSDLVSDLVTKSTSPDEMQQIETGGEHEIPTDLDPEAQEALVRIRRLAKAVETEQAKERQIVSLQSRLERSVPEDEEAGVLTEEMVGHLEGSLNSVNKIYEFVSANEHRFRDSVLQARKRRKLEEGGSFAPVAAEANPNDDPEEDIPTRPRPRARGLVEFDAAPSETESELNCLVLAYLTFAPTKNTAKR